MSKLVHNVVNTARIFRGETLVAKVETNHTSICLVTKFLCFTVAKREPYGRFFADKEMIAYAGGPWFIRSFKLFLEPQLSKLHALHVIAKLKDIEAKDLFSYQSCYYELDFNHNTLANPIALQLVQKAQLLAIADETLARCIAQAG